MIENRNVDENGLYFVVQKEILKDYLCSEFDKTNFIR